jgi:lipopolysaccharide transport system ATP-binding protein
MSDTVIKVENLSKKYIISHQQKERYTALRDVMARGVKNLGKKLIAPFSRSTTPHLNNSTEEFYALKDINFEIKQGDRVGIIGRNGAGKSTLLKILSRITEPSTGRIELTGRVASLLEVGTGFHPELTGRENIFLNGAILGMTKAEIKKKFDEIVDFAEVEKFLDTPVKRYSSGMYVRLAFAVAAHLEPEILIVDEVLAVGDTAFQKKCLGKMEDVSVKKGRTVLFVSHNMGAIKSLCSEGMLLDEGHLIINNSAEIVINKYLTDTFLNGNHFISGTRKLKLVEFKILKNKMYTNSFNTFDHVTFSITYVADDDYDEVTIAICFNNMSNTRITSLWSSYMNQFFTLKKGLNSFNFYVQRIKLIPGMYEIIMYVERKGITIERIDNFKQIVVGTPELYSQAQIPSADQGLYLEEFTIENI